MLRLQLRYSCMRRPDRDDKELGMAGWGGHAIWEMHRIGEGYVSVMGKTSQG